VSGIETLFSGAYIGVDAGVSPKRRPSSTGLSAPPFVLRGEPGAASCCAPKTWVARRGLAHLLPPQPRGPCGGLQARPDADELAVQIFIEGAVRQAGQRQTRFWNASGVEVSLNAAASR
jgi:paraquat-inducible protein B